MLIFNKLSLFFLSGMLLLGACGWQKKVPEVSKMDDLPYPFEMKKIDIGDDIEIAYADLGGGKETLIFIHGLGSYAPAWKKNLEDLQKDYRCIAVDLPGYGKSSKGNYEGSMRFFANSIIRLMDKLNLKNAVLAGHSMGGQIAITAALAYPERVSKLILIAPAGLETFHKGEKQWFREVLTTDAVKLTTVEQIRSNIGWNFYRFPAEAEFMISDRIAMRKCEDFNAYAYIIPKCVEGMVDEPVFDHLADVKQPALVIFGKQDNLIPNRFLNGGHTEKYAREGSEKMPNARLEMIDEAGHFVMFEKSEAVNRLVREFLN